MTVDPDSVIKGFNVFENKAISLVVVENAKAIQPFSFDKGMEGFNTGIVIRITGITVA